MVSVEVDEEIRKLRDLVRRQSADLDRLSPDAISGSVSFVAITTTATAYPTTARSIFSIQMQTLSGVEAEGALVSLSGSASLNFAANLGAKIPPPGTEIIVTLVPYAFVFRYG